MAVRATVQHQEGSKVTLEVEVASQAVRESLEEAYRRLAQRVRVPGFRPGRVPPAVLRARLGRQPIYDEALEMLLPRAYQEAVEANHLDPVDEPRFDIIQMEEDKPLVFKAEVTVRPEVTLGPYRGVKADRTVYEPDDTDVDRVLRRLQERLAVLEPVDGPVQRGHFVDLDYDALLDGRPFRGGAVRGRTLEVGREQVVAGFDEAIEGMHAGERREFEIRLPEGYPDKGLAGHTLSFAVTVQSVKARRLPPVDDELARDVGAYDTLDQLREAIRAELKQLADRKSDAEARRQVLDRVVQGASVEIPEVMVRRRTDSLIRDLAERLAVQGLTVERYLELTGRSAAQLVESLEPEARRQLTEELVLDAVARAEGLAVDRDEVERRLSGWLQPDGTDDGVRVRDRRRRQEQARREALRERLRRQLETALLREQAVQWLVSHAQLVDQPARGVRDEDLEARVEARLLAERMEAAGRAGEEKGEASPA